jgi:DNA-binding response OmpR family regulator
MAKKKIMVVDDEPDIRDTVKIIMEKEGFEVVTAVSGDDCLKKMYEKPDLILMDIMMPGTPTKDVVKKIKGVKIAFLSVVRVSEGEKENLMKNKNVVDYIQKPFNVKELVERVKKILKE